MWTLIEGDCLQAMANIPDKSIDMILCDLPYGTTACKWDTVIPFEPLWAQYKRVIKPNRSIVLTSSNPFSAKLIANDYGLYKHSWIWEKQNFSDFANANCRPMKIHEDVLVFSFASDVSPGKQKLLYNPQGLVEQNKKNKRSRHSETTGVFRENEYVSKFTNYPKTILFYPGDKDKLHPTQKPVALFEYLIKTYTLEGETVLDNCAGSGTTGVACLNTNRNCIMIEKDAGYCDIIRKRM